MIRIMLTAGIDCHILPGVASFNSYFNFRGSDEDVSRPFTLSEMAVSEVDATTLKWKDGRPNWIALRKLLGE